MKDILKVFDGKKRLTYVFSSVVTSFLAFMTVLFIVLNNKYNTVALLSAAITFGTMFYHYAVRLTVGYAVNKCLSPKLNPDSVWFVQKKFEKKLYKLLKVKKWKLFMPTANPESFSLEKNTPKDIIRTMCISELVHELDIFLSFLPLLLAIPFGKFPVFLITSVLAALCDLPFVFMQRFNRPRVLRLMKKQMNSTRE